MNVVHGPEGFARPPLFSVPIVGTATATRLDGDRVCRTGHREPGVSMTRIPVVGTSDIPAQAIVIKSVAPMIAQNPRSDAFRSVNARYGAPIIEDSLGIRRAPASRTHFKERPIVAGNKAGPIVDHEDCPQCFLRRQAFFGQLETIPEKSLALGSNNPDIVRVAGMNVVPRDRRDTRQNSGVELRPGADAHYGRRQCRRWCQARYRCIAGDGGGRKAWKRCIASVLELGSDAAYWLVLG